MTTQGRQEEDHCGDGIVPYLDGGDGHRHLHVRENDAGLYIHRTNVRFPALLSYYKYVRCSLWGK